MKVEVAAKADLAQPANVYLSQTPAKDGRILITSGYRDRALATKLSNHIHEIAGDRDYLIMHVCGT